MKDRIKELAGSQNHWRIISVGVKLNANFAIENGNSHSNGGGTNPKK